MSPRYDQAILVSRNTVLTAVNLLINVFFTLPVSRNQVSQLELLNRSAKEEDMAHFL